MFSTRIKRMLLGCALGCAASTSAQSFDISWNTIDSGATSSTAGSFSLSGTIGQPDASSFSPPLSGGPWELVGGFWPVAAAGAPPCAGCDTNCDGSINGFDIQPFVEALSPSAPTRCSPCAADTNGDGSVNGFDIQGFLECLGG